MTESIQVVGGKDLRRISTELRRMDDKQVRKRFSRELRKTAKPLVPVVRRSIMSIPSQHDGTLRREMARAVTLSVRTSGRDAGVVIRVDGRKMPSGKGRLPALMEGSRKPWRHPVYGNRDNWATQQEHPYFYRVAVPYGRRTRRAVIKAAEAIARKIT